MGRARMRTDVEGVKPMSVWPDTAEKDRAFFAARLRELLDGWEGGFEQGASWYSRDERARIWDGTAVERPGYEAYAAAAAEFMGGLESLSNEIDDVQVLRAPEGGLAITVTLLRNVGRTKDGQNFEEHMRETLVWGHDGEDWRVVHEHTSHLPEPGAS